MGGKCYVTPTFSGVPSKGEKNQNWLPQWCLLRCPKVVGSAISPVQSRGPPIMESQIRIGSSAMPSRGHKCGRKCYVTPAFSGVPNKWEQNQNCLPQPCLLGGQQWVEVLGQPCILGGPQQGGRKSRLAAIHAFWGVHKWANVLHHPRVLGGPQQKGTKSELAASAMPSRGLKSG